jgi:peroxiredoxin
MTGGSGVDTQAWADTYGLTAPVTADSPANLSSEWGVSAIPSQHLIGRGGVILTTNQYHIDEDTLLEAMAR